jgi:hypothetical protein
MGSFIIIISMASLLLSKPIFQYEKLQSFLFPGAAAPAWACSFYIDPKNNFVRLYREILGCLKIPALF